MDLCGFLCNLLSPTTFHMPHLPDKAFNPLILRYTLRSRRMRSDFASRRPPESGMVTATTMSAPLRITRV